MGSETRRPALGPISHNRLGQHGLCRDVPRQQDTSLLTTTRGGHDSRAPDIGARVVGAQRGERAGAPRRRAFIARPPVGAGLPGPTGRSPHAPWGSWPTEGPTRAVWEATRSPAWKVVEPGWWPPGSRLASLNPEPRALARG